MESTFTQSDQHVSRDLGIRPARVSPHTASRAITISYWIATILFCLQMSFTAYAQMRLPQVSQEFARLGFSASSFRLELSWAKLAGVAALLLPIVPAWVKEWAYAGLAITLVSALIAHISIGEGAGAWGWAAGTAVLWALSFFFWRRIRAAEQTNS
jgi:hypothetical protein